MNGFFIKKVSVKGNGKVPSSVEFQDGFNLVYGPSNTGKTYIINCIDYLLGGKDLPFEDEPDYDRAEMVIESRSGGTATISRKFSENTVNISFSTINNFPNGDYTTGSKGNYQNLLLRLIGIPENVKIFSKQDYSSEQKLTLRSIINLFLIHEGNIFSEKSIINNPGYSNPTAEKLSLKYLYDGTIPEKPASLETPDEKISRRAILSYTDKKLRELEEKTKQFEREIEKYKDMNVEEILKDKSEKLDTIQNEIEKINVALSSKNIEIQKVNEDLNNSLLLKERYEILESQYTSDIERLKFIIDGEKVRNDITQNTVCPYCEGILPARKHLSYIKSETQELESTQNRLNELRDVLQDLNSDILETESRLKTMESEKNQLLESSHDFSNQIGEILDSISGIKDFQKVKGRIEMLEEMKGIFQQDKENSGKPLQTQKLEPKDEIDESFFTELGKLIGENLATSGYDKFNSCVLDKSTFDVSIDGKPKKSQGKGYRAYINSLYAYSLLKFLTERGKHTYGLLILDSPILSLEETEKASDSMKKGLFTMFASIDFTGQIIVIENKIPNIDYSKSNLVEFTKDNETGRYGFFEKE